MPLYQVIVELEIEAADEEAAVRQAEREISQSAFVCVHSTCATVPQHCAWSDVNGPCVSPDYQRAEQRNADHIDGYARDDLGESPDY